MFFLIDKLWFPPVEEANEDGLLAIGGDLSIERLLLAYKSGIFPWYNEGEDILWWSPNPRMVLFPEELKVSKSMKKILDKGVFSFTENQDFNFVIENCSKIARPTQDGTWISKEMKEAYYGLHQLSYAKSVEVWHNNEIVGGFYGVQIGNIFCGESMFSKMSNASKAGFIYFVQKYSNTIRLIDCQMHTNHLASLGAKEIGRSHFMQTLSKAFQ